MSEMHGGGRVDAEALVPLLRWVPIIPVFPDFVLSLFHPFLEM